MVVFSFFVAYATNAQLSTLEVGGFLGTSGYLGDLNKSDWFSREPKPAYGGLARFHLNSHFAIRASYNHGRLSGHDYHYADRSFRNFSTTTTVDEIIGQIEYSFIADNIPKSPRHFRPKLVPYIFLGGGVVLTDPKAILTDMLIATADIVAGVEEDLNTTYSKLNLALPFGIGIKYRLTPTWTLAADASFRISNTDYLDGISKAANPNKTDRYKFSGITLSYRFPKSPTRCATEFY